MMVLFSKLLGALITPIRTAAYWFMRLIPGMKQAIKIPVPLRFALLSFLVLILIGVACYVASILDSERGLPENWWEWPRPLIIGGLLIVIPILVYLFVAKLLSGGVSRFPDIDFAWKQGLEALDSHGIDLTETPVFLMLGSPGPGFSTNLLTASRISLNVNETPEGPAALHFYANQDSIYIFCTDTSCLSKLSSMAESIVEAGPSPTPAIGGVPQGTIMAGPAPGGGGAAGPGQTMVGGAPGAPSPGGAPAGPGQTMVGGAPGAPDPAPAPGPGPSPGGNVGMQTMQIDTDKGIGEYIESIDQAVVAQKPTLSPADVNEQNARLEYVCDLLRKKRAPVCPVNGILALVPFRVIEYASDQVQAASQRDLHILRDRLKLRCPLTVLVTDMEREPGFRELVRRVGVERAKEQRFGKGFNVWNAPTDEQLEAVGRHACGAFEDWTYMLFKEHDGLRKPGNTKLFGLLCKIRGTFTEALTNVLADGFGYKPDRDPELNDRQFMFSGCYFAATGNTDDRQAFVKSVLLKMGQQEGELTWMRDAIEEDNRLQLFANLFTLLGVASIVALVGMVGYQFFGDEIRKLWEE